MTEEGIGRLLVMEDDTLVGVVSRSSITLEGVGEGVGTFEDAYW
ncbi:CBS domain-containing protein [Candidatus Methanophagaceae archaeon]|nr:CBS domain-containing protein [Methanophagales archaeon]